MRSKNRFLDFFLLFLFVFLAFRLGYLEVWFFPKIRTHTRNIRPVLRELSFKRGEILDREGRVLAFSQVGKNGFYRRLYPYKELFFHPVGYFDPQLGYSGLEKKLNDYLSSRSSSFQTRANQGMKVVLTLDAALQEKAFSLLKGKKGVILAIDPRTGEILTYASSPSVSLEEVKERAGEAFKDQPQIDRVSQGLYPPGSVFKIVTLAAALEAGLPLSQTFKAPASLNIEGGKVTNYQRKDYGTLSLGKAFEKSVNTVFAQVGLKLGKEKLKKEAEKFGFNQVFNFELPVRKSSFPWPETRLDLAWQAIGQGKVLVTPLQVGILGLVLANQGTLKMPFLVKEIKTSGGKPFRINQTETISLLEREVARKLKEAMVKVVSYGTGRQVKLPGVKVAGKTGTAELDGGRPHSWFVCFAPAEKPEIVLVTLVEHGGLGGRKAAFLSREFLRFFFNQRGQVLVE